MNSVPHFSNAIPGSMELNELLDDLCQDHPLEGSSFSQTPAYDLFVDLIADKNEPILWEYFSNARKVIRANEQLKHDDPELLALRRLEKFIHDMLNLLRKYRSPILNLKMEGGELIVLKNGQIQFWTEDRSHWPWELGLLPEGLCENISTAVSSVVDEFNSDREVPLEIDLSDISNKPVEILHE